MKLLYACTAWSGKSRWRLLRQDRLIGLKCNTQFVAYVEHMICLER